MMFTVEFQNQFIISKGHKSSTNSKNPQSND